MPIPTRNQIEHLGSINQIEHLGSLVTTVRLLKLMFGKAHLKIWKAYTIYCVRMELLLKV